MPRRKLRNIFKNILESLEKPHQSENLHIFQERRNPLMLEQEQNLDGKVLDLQEMKVRAQKKRGHL